jgi:hypothetical protein
LVLFNGAPETKKRMLEMADGLLAHRKQGPGGRWSTTSSIVFKTDQEVTGGGAAGGGGGAPWFILWSAYQWTGDKKYLQPLLDNGPAGVLAVNADALDILKLRDSLGPQLAAGGVGEEGGQFAWQVTGDTKYLEPIYRTHLEFQADREYINTEGSLWIDRIADGGGSNTGDLQRQRLGGVALQRDRIYPGNAVGWQFEAPATDESVGILTPVGSTDHLKFLVYNLDAQPVKAHMTGWQIDPGKWEITQAVQGGQGGASPDAPLRDVTTRTAAFERSTDLDFTFPPHVTTVLELKLVTKGVPYWLRPDLGIDPEDVKIEGNRMKVTVHSLGSVDAPASKVVLRDRTGKILATSNAPVLKAPLDLLPKTTVVDLALPKADWKGGTVTIEMSGGQPEITQKNNRVQLQN